MSTAREGLTPAAPARAEAGTAAVPCEAVLPAPRRGPAGAGPRYHASGYSQPGPGAGGAPANLSAWPTRTWRAAARRPPRSPVPRRCRPRTPVRGRRRDARLFQQPRQIASFAPSHPRAGRRTVPARTGRSPAPIGECQMMTRAAKSALAAANYVTRRHRRPASIIRQQARPKTEPWPSKQAQIISDLCPQLKDAPRDLWPRRSAGPRAVITSAPRRWNPVTAGQAASQTVYSCIAAVEVNGLNCRGQGRTLRIRQNHCRAPWSVAARELLPAEGRG